MHGPNTHILSSFIQLSDLFQDFSPLHLLFLVRVAPNCAVLAPRAWLWLEAVLVVLAVDIYRHTAVTLWAANLEPCFVEHFRRVGSCFGICCTLFAGLFFSAPL